MKIKKISEKYSFYPDGANYVLDFGQIKLGEKPTVELEMIDLIDSKLFHLKPTCGCLTSDVQNINTTTQRVKVTYSQCDATIAKVMEIRYNNVKLGILKITGSCR